MVLQWRWRQTMPLLQAKKKNGHDDEENERPDNYICSHVGIRSSQVARPSLVDVQSFETEVRGRLFI